MTQIRDGYCDPEMQQPYQWLLSKRAQAGSVCHNMLVSSPPTIPHERH